MSQSPSRSIRALIEQLVAPVLKAGATEMRHYRGHFEVITKADRSPVTIADREAEEILLEALARIAPGVPVVAEEAAAEGRLPQIGDVFFLVDPLDGTKEFINKRGEFTVNVALIEKGRPIGGIVYAPAIDDLYATLGPAEAARAKISPEATPRSLADCGFQAIRTRSPDMAKIVAVASRSHMTPETEAFLGQFKVSERRDSGSSLKFCAVARGDADIYPRLAPTMEWDIAAGHAVLAAAGGAVTMSDGTPMVYGKAGAGFRNTEFVAWGTREPFRA
ncbi:MAG: 3'(2'),5'-bisphosphate nucleotidase CysQ [Proteobacteria bacterium]|nr:3'(2'),5'-bisphosphate nucleotidase CysQ [Pseudomonadota bacterium]